MELLNKSELLKLSPDELNSNLEGLDDGNLEKLISGSDIQTMERILEFSNAVNSERIVMHSNRRELLKYLIFVKNSASVAFLETLSVDFLRGIGRNLDDVFLLKIANSGGTNRTLSALISDMSASRQDFWNDFISNRQELLALYSKLAESFTTDASDNLRDNRFIIEGAIGHYRAKIDAFEAEINKKKEEDGKHHPARAYEERMERERSDFYKKQALLHDKEIDLAKRVQEFEEANKKSVQERIEKKVPEYVTSAVEVLKASEEFYRHKASQWSNQGTLVLIAAIAATVAIALYGGGFFAKTDKELGWPMLMFISFKGLIVLGVLSLWAKHAFSVSNSYIHEAIKRSDRAHAINFGKLYLEIYGSTVERKELLDIFENWNIATESAFSKATPSEFDPKAFEKFVEVAKMLNPVKSDKD